MAALSGLLRNEINHTDCLQINLSSRATAAVQHDIEVCRLVGARSRALGLVPVDQSVDACSTTATAPADDPRHLPQLPRPTRQRRRVWKTEKARSRMSAMSSSSDFACGPGCISSAMMRGE